MSQYEKEYEEDDENRDETRKVVLWQVADTPKAYIFSTFPKGHKDAKQQWIPRSVIHHISREPAADLSQFPRCVVEVEEWFLDKNNL